MRRSTKNPPPSIQWVTPAVNVRRSCLAPSPLTLVILAALCNSTTASPHPCPDFLCPPPHSNQPRASTSSLQDAVASPRQKRHNHHRPTPAIRRRQGLPTKYAQGEDGRWRPDVNWSLHGQTITCSYASSTPASSPFGPPNDDTSPIESLDDSAALPNDKDAASTEAAAPSDLPSGWSPPPTRASFYKWRLVVGFSISLALLIAILIGVCALMRHRRIRATKRKARLKAILAGEEDSISNRRAADKHVRKKKKLWARSSALWKINAHLTSRKRRPKASNPSLSQQEKEISIRDPHTADTDASDAVVTDQLEIVARSPLVSTTGSNDEEILRHHSTQDSIPEDAPSSYEQPIESPATDAASPPSYWTRRGASATDPQHSPYPTDHGYLHFESQGRGPSAEKFARFDETNSVQSVEARDTATSSEGQESALGVAHIATDDKTLLARMAQSASSPTMIQSSPIVAAAAPDWIDELTHCEAIQSSVLNELPAMHNPPSSEFLHRVDNLDPSGADLLGSPSSPPEEGDYMATASAPLMNEPSSPLRVSLPIYEP